MRPEGLAIKLLANGEPVPEQGAGMSTDMNGITFEHYFDPLPEKLQTLQIQVGSLSAEYDVKQEVALKKDGQGQNLEVLGQQIEINRIYQAQGSSYVTLTTAETTLLTRVYLVVDGNKVALKAPRTDDYKKQADGRILHTRTLHFPETGKSYRLDIERMSFLKNVNKRLDIPVN